MRTLGTLAQSGAAITTIGAITANRYHLKRFTIRKL